MPSRDTKKYYSNQVRRWAVQVSLMESVPTNEKAKKLTTQYIQSRKKQKASQFVIYAIEAAKVQLPRQLNNYLCKQLLCQINAAIAMYLSV